jgi:sporulation protein YlmC with PRC-barrel domain
MKNLWTWGGEFFGYMENDNLWTYSGKHIGRLYGDEVYSTDGAYLGEIKNDSRLITNLQNKNKRVVAFSPSLNRVGIVPSVNVVGNIMFAGYEYFSSPDNF